MPDFRDYVRRHLPPLGVPAPREAEIAEELALELQERYERAVREGLSPQGAWEKVTRQIEWSQLGQDLGAVWGEAAPEPPKRSAGIMTNFWSDVQYGARILRRSPGFAAAAALTIALGIGPNTAIFSLLYGVFWRPLENPNASRQSVIWLRHGDERGFGPRHGIHVRVRDYLEWRKESTSFEKISAVTQRDATLNDDAGYPDRFQVQSYTPGFITSSGGRMALGRDFVEEEGQSGKNAVVVISNKFWRERYSSEPRIIGKKLRLDGVPHQIVGVLTPGWWDRRREPMWPVLAVGPEMIDSNMMLTVMAVRKPGVSNEQAQAEMDRVAQRLAERYPQTNAGWTIRVDESRNNWLSDRTRSNLGLLMGAVSLVLLIACLNVANLLLARGGSRLREMAVRVSMGATRRQIFTQLLTESLMLSLLGGALGVLMSFGLLKVFLGLAPPFWIPPAVRIDISSGVLAFSFGTTLLAGLIFGCAPALQMSRLGIAESLRQGGGRSGLGHGRHRLGKILVVAEFAFALTLLAGAALVMRSYWSRTHADFGVSTEKILTFELPPRRGRINSREQAEEYNRAVKTKLESVAGVRSVVAMSALPLLDSGSLRVAPSRNAPADRSEYPIVRARSAGPGFFETFGAQLLRGRKLDERDGSSPNVLINETFAKQYFAGVDPLGQELQVPAARGDRFIRPQVVGIYKDIQNGEQFGGAVRPEVITLMTGFPAQRIAVKTAGDPARMAKSIAAAIHDIDPEMPMAKVRTMEQIVAEQTAFDRFETVLYGSFAGLSLLLAALGIYGLLAFIVSQRMPELGLRIAMGAGSGGIFALVVKDGLKLAGVGLALGSAGAWYGAKILQSSLYGAGNVDPIVFGAVVAVLLAAALIACLLPAWRAASTDPLISLRAE